MTDGPSFRRNLRKKEKRKVWENWLGKKRKEKKRERTIPFTYLFLLIFYDSDHDDHDENDNEGMNSLVIIV